MSPADTSQQRAHPLLELVLFRLREFYRQPEVLFWAFLFPLILILVLGVAFRPVPPEAVPVLVAAASADDPVVKALSASKDLRVRLVPQGEAELALVRGEAALLVLPGEPPAYRYDPTHPEARTTRLLVEAALQAARGRKDAFTPRDETAVTRGGRYVDWLVPGILGMQIMNGCLWGIGFSLVEMRSRKLLKRFAVTPMKRGHFLAASAIHRTLVVVIEALLMVGVGVIFFDVRPSGSPLAFGVVLLVGTAAFAGVGLLVAARPESPEVAAGLMNIPMLPQMVVSGVFFSSTKFPDWMAVPIKALPLTALIDALRRIANEGAGVEGVVRELLILATWAVVTLALAMRLFRWS